GEEQPHALRIRQAGDGTIEVGAKIAGGAAEAEVHRRLIHAAQMTIEEEEPAVRRPLDRLEQLERLGHLGTRSLQWLVMNGRYGGARTAAPRVAEHFAKYIAAARRDVNKTVAFSPDAATLETIIDAAFWASLRREEGYTPTISLAYLPPEQGGRPVL